MPQAQLYVDGCDISLDPATAENVRANLAAVGGRTYILRPGDVRSLGSAAVLDGRGCLALGIALVAQDVLEELERLVRAGSRPGRAMAEKLPRGARIVEEAPADWWLVPGGPLADITALRRPRHIVRGGVRVGGR